MEDSDGVSRKVNSNSDRVNDLQGTDGVPNLVKKHGVASCSSQPHIARTTIWVHIYIDGTLSTCHVIASLQRVIM